MTEDITCSAQTRFQAALPNVPYLSSSSFQETISYITDRLEIDPGSNPRIEKAGEGNMNGVFRVFLGDDSYVLKQSRPWVEKYPMIEAPIERAISEANYYQIVANYNEIAARMPKPLDANFEAYALIFEDLGESNDFTSLYAGAKMSLEHIDELSEYLRHLHGIKLNHDQMRKLENRAMRELNHEHIFRFPLNESNGFDLDAITPGLQEAANVLIADSEYVSRVDELGSVYLSNDKTLLQGDFFPGSWLLSNQGLHVIDPEFAYCGHSEFDWAVWSAHMMLSRQPLSVIEAILEKTRSKQLDKISGFWGVEIMRRLIGVAQLPLNYGMEIKGPLLEISKELVANRLEPALESYAQLLN